MTLKTTAELQNTSFTEKKVPTQKIISQTTFKNNLKTKTTIKVTRPAKAHL